MKTGSLVRGTKYYKNMIGIVIKGDSIYLKVYHNTFKIKGNYSMIFEAGLDLIPINFMDEIK